MCLMFAYHVIINKIIICTCVTANFLMYGKSLMTLKLIDEITNTKGDSKRECLGQGFANIVTGIFGGMGGCGIFNFYT